MAEPAAFEEEKTDEVLVLLVHDGDDHLVLVRDTQSRFPGKWEFPGGRIRLGEDYCAAAIRIARKELGIRIEPGQIGRKFVAEVSRGGRTVRSVRINLPAGPEGDIPVPVPGARHVCSIVPKADIRTYMPRRSDRKLMTNGHRG